MSNVKNNEALKRFELQVEDKMAYADYKHEGNVLYLNYVFAPESLRGTGAASNLMQGIMEIARQNGDKVYPICSYAVSWLSQHEYYQDLVV